MTPAKRTSWTWGLICLAVGGWAGCTTNQPPKIAPAQAIIDARTALLAVAEDAHDALGRRAAMETIGEVDPTDGGILKQALDDPEEGVRFAAAMSIGDIRYAPALPVLKSKAKMYTGEQGKRPYCGILYALYRLGDDSHLGDLASMLFDTDWEVRSVAAQVMGKIGNPAAVDLLKRSVLDETNETAKYNMIEALAALGDAASQVKLEGYAEGYFVDLQLVAIPALGREYSPNTMQILNELMETRFSPRVRVVAAGVMAHLGQATAAGYKLCADAAMNPRRYSLATAATDRAAASNELASVQELAALSLGWMHKTEAVDILHGLLENDEGSVRVAAAESIFRLLSPAPGAAPSSPAGSPVAAPKAPAAAEPSPSAETAPSPSAATEPARSVLPPGLHTSGAKE